MLQEGDAVNPVKFTALPLPHVVLDVGPDDMVDHVFREKRYAFFGHIPIVYRDMEQMPKLINAIKTNPDAEAKVLEVV